MNARFTYIANWKSYFTYCEAVTWAEQHAAALHTRNHNAEIVLCPDFLAIPALRAIAPNIKLGAQNCSPFDKGPYTGQVSASSLKDAGVTHCIVGHHECRTLLHESSTVIAKKIVQLAQHGITPILCVSDPYEIAQHEFAQALRACRSICIAYEPIAAIGSGNAASVEAITDKLALIKKIIDEYAPDIHARLLYGGSVTSDNAQEFKRIPNLDGFLIGRASTDFQELKKIVH